MSNLTSNALYDEIHAAKVFLYSRVADIRLHKPLAGIVCGSGLGMFAERLSSPVSISYRDIPGFSQCTVEGHKGMLVFGYIEGTPVICMLGRLHYFEGYTMQQTTFPIRTMAALGISVLIATNAAGGLNPDYRIGDVMIIEDHVAIPLLTGVNPLLGPNDERNGSRFTSLSDAYSQHLRKFVAAVVEKADLFDINACSRDDSRCSLRSGIYMFVAGPNYESPAEARAMRALGCDAVGMSTAPEVLVAAHVGIPVIGFSLITCTELLSKAPTFETEEEDAGNAKQKVIEATVSHEEVLEAGKAHAKRLLDLVATIVPQLHTVL